MNMNINIVPTLATMAENSQINVSQAVSFNKYFSQVGANTFKKITGKSHLTP